MKFNGAILAKWQILQKNGLRKRPFIVEECPQSLISFNRRYTSLVKLYYRLPTNPIDPYFIFAARNCVQPSYSQRSTTRKYAGDLSFSRIYAFENLTGAMAAFLKNAEEKKQLHQFSDIVCLKKAIHTKLNNIRKDRVNNVANKMEEKAKRWQVNFIVQETLSIQGDAAARRSQNKRSVNWCASRQTEQNRRKASEIGIPIYSVWPEFSSHTDFLVENIGVRYKKVKLHSLTNKYWKGKSLDYNKTYRWKDKMYSDKWKEFLHTWGVDNYTSLVKLIESNLVPDEVVYVPFQGGEYFLLHNGEFENADRNAACYIGIRGLRSILRWWNEREPAENGD